jgi:hypothetical protein
MSEQQSSADSVGKLREKIADAIRSRTTVTESTDAIMDILAAAPQTASEAVWSAEVHDRIIKRLMADVGMPNSTSLYTAFHQFANELCALSNEAGRSQAVCAQQVALDRKTIANAVEPIIIRRLFEKKVDGYTLPMSWELADAIVALTRPLRPDEPAISSHQRSQGE